FKAQRAEFQDLIYQNIRLSGASAQPLAMQVGLGTQFAATAANFSRGPLQATSNPLDLAIAGDGFFKVEMNNGTTAYTRDGSFKVNGTGELVTNDGYRVVPNLTVPTGSTALTISPDGTVSAKVPGQDDPQIIGQLQITLFSNPSGLTRMGQNLYTAGGASGEATEVTPGDNGGGQIQSGFLEGSNVEIVVEMVRMITAQRAYEINSKAIQTADDMLGILNNLKR
ncbi:MAG TPA: flagellar basal-body rod protein FlgG, partial [Fimbriimonadaceae bacterium]|nr:flagellar basal-body rod protein FlgG [Fimbriimonadaceae bacterium]